MKRLLILIGCILSLALILAGRPSKTGSEGGSHAGASVAEPAPQTQDWDPERQGVGDLTEGPRTEVAPKDRKPIMVVGQRFTPTEFAHYMRTEIVPVLKQKNHWRPTSIVLHNTAVPRIAQRPEGFTPGNMKGLASYYGLTQGWRSGPHLFVDQNGIWVFTPLTQPGTHSPSWNRVAWGIEQLGDFSSEDYNAGNGEKIRDNAIAALAILSISGNINVKAETLRFHFEDPRTTHKGCPGNSCKKPEVMTRVKDEVAKWRERWNSL